MLLYLDCPYSQYYNNGSACLRMPISLLQMASWQKTRKYITNPVDPFKISENLFKNFIIRKNMKSLRDGKSITCTDQNCICLFQFRCYFFIYAHKIISFPCVIFLTLCIEMIILYITLKLLSNIMWVGTVLYK